jgi:alpha-1,3-rhamnosyltransferase
MIKENQTTNLPLVSIIIITYNSSKYVLETLESAKHQTYRNIELIVTDDCSTDTTVGLCRDWLKKNNEIFVRTILVESSVNKGIAPNCNQGLAASNGEWIKFIAGDDVLLPGCISQMIDFIYSNKVETINILSTGIHTFGETNKEINIFTPKEFCTLTAKQQLHYLLKKGCTVQGSSLFFKRSVVTTMDGFDIRYPFFEDHPIIVKATNQGFKINCLSEVCVNYRVHSKSIILDKTINKFASSYYSYIKEVIPTLLLSEKLYLRFWHTKIHFYLQKKKESFPFKYIIFRYLILLVLDPFSYYAFINKILITRKDRINSQESFKVKK